MTFFHRRLIVRTGLGRIACTQCTWCGSLLQMSHVAWSVCLFACVGHTGELYKNRVNRWRCCLCADSCGSKQPCIRWGSGSDESIRSREGWQDGDAVFCQLISDNCFQLITSTCFLSVAVFNDATTMKSDWATWHFSTLSGTKAR